MQPVRQSAGIHVVGLNMLDSKRLNHSKYTFFSSRVYMTHCTTNIFCDIIYPGVR